MLVAFGCEQALQLGIQAAQVGFRDAPDAEQRFREVAEAYVAGMAERLEAGLPVTGIQSVASFFVSRIDTKVDALLPEDSPLRGRTAVANAKLAYADVYQAVFDHDPRWAAVEAAGGARQRPLWASTSTKKDRKSTRLNSSH
mgnify:CR=1 FL=1